MDHSGRPHFLRLCCLPKLPENMSDTSPVPPDERSDHKNMYNDVAIGDRLSIREDFITCDNVVVTKVADVSTRARATPACARRACTLR